MPVTATLAKEPKTSGQGELFSQVKGAVDMTSTRKIGSLSNNDGNVNVNGNENLTQKVNSRCFKLHRPYSKSFNL